MFSGLVSPRDLTDNVMEESFKIKQLTSVHLIHFIIINILLFIFPVIQLYIT